jgi:hypothetical protein
VLVAFYVFDFSTFVANCAIDNYFDGPKGFFIAPDNLTTPPVVSSVAALGFRVVEAFLVFGLLVSVDVAVSFDLAVLALVVVAFLGFFVATDSSTVEVSDSDSTGPTSTAAESFDSNGWPHSTAADSIESNGRPHSTAEPSAALSFLAVEPEVAVADLFLPVVVVAGAFFFFVNFMAYLILYSLMLPFSSVITIPFISYLSLCMSAP